MPDHKKDTKESPLPNPTTGALKMTGPGRMQARLAYALFAIYLVLLAWLVLFKLQFTIPVLEEGRTINLMPFLGAYNANGAMHAGEIRNNILAFIPFGVYIGMLKQRWPFVKKALAAFALTVGFEAAQFAFAIGRADITDVLSNTLGGIIGVGIYALLSGLLKGRTSKVIIILAAAVTVCVLALIAVLLLNQRWIRIR